MRRNLLLAQALQRSRLHAVVLMIAGAREASLLTAAAGVDCVSLPSLRKDEHGQYHPRHLEVSLADLLTLRAKTACGALEAFAPDVLIVDNVPRGALRELDPVLETLRDRRRTRVVLGLPDPGATGAAAHRFQRPESRAAIAGRSPRRPATHVPAPPVPRRGPSCGVTPRSASGM